MKKQVKPANARLKKTATCISIFFAVFFFVIVIGVFIPSIPYVGETGTLLETFFSIHLLIASFLFLVISYLSYYYNKKNLTTVILALSIIYMVGFILPVINLINFANNYNTKISWSKWLSIELNMGSPDISKSVSYANIDGKELLMEISFPERKKNHDRLTPLVFIHGGGFVSGARNQEPGWTKFYNERGYVVFDVDYRLATVNHPTWDKAAPDIASAIVWIGNHAENYNVDMNKLIIAGASAGGGLALQVAYGLKNQTVKSYEKGFQYQPRIVVALYPAADMSYQWFKNTGFFNMKSQQLCDIYIGGSPEKYPKAYHTVNVTENIIANDPPTLIIVGKADHLLPYAIQKSLANKLGEMNVPYEFVAIPYNDHFFTIATGCIGNQISYKIASDFLDEYSKN